MQGPPLQSAPSTPHVHAAMGGIGSTVLFQEDSKIGPEPTSYGLFDGEDARGFDGFLQQLAEDTAAYVRTVCNTIVLTVPKAIIHCQVPLCPRAPPPAPPLSLNAYTANLHTLCAAHNRALQNLGSTTQPRTSTWIGSSLTCSNKRCRNC